MLIKPQTVLLRNGIRIVIGGRRIYVRVGDTTHCLHISASGEVLRITASPLLPDLGVGAICEPRPGQ
jgi:hypothetical protein